MQISLFCLSNCYYLKKFELSENSKLQTISLESFSVSPIKYLYIPSQLTSLKEGWCPNTPLLTETSQIHQLVN